MLHIAKPCLFDRAWTQWFRCIGPKIRDRFKASLHTLVLVLSYALRDVYDVLDDVLTAIINELLIAMHLQITIIADKHSCIGSASDLAGQCSLFLVAVIVIVA